MPRRPRRSRSPAPGRQSQAAVAEGDQAPPPLPDQLAAPANNEPPTLPPSPNNQAAAVEAGHVNLLYDKYGSLMSVTVACLVLTAAMTGVSFRSSSMGDSLHSWSMAAAVALVAAWDLALSHAVYKQNAMVSALSAVTSDKDAPPSVEPVEADLACPICFDVFYEPVSLECQHNVCKQCFTAWIRSQVQNHEPIRCPVARCPISPLIPNNFNRALQAQCESRCPAAFAARKLELAQQQERAAACVAARRRVTAPWPRFLLDTSQLPPRLETALALLCYMLLPLSALRWCWQRYSWGAELLTAKGIPSLGAQVAAGMCLFAAHCAHIFNCCSRAKDIKRKKAAFEAAFYSPLLLVAAIALPLTRPLAATLLDFSWCACTYAVLYLWHGGHGLQLDYELASRPPPDQYFPERPRFRQPALATDWEPLFSQRHRLFYYRQRSHLPGQLSASQTLDRRRAEIAGGLNPVWPAGIAALACLVSTRLFFYVGGQWATLGRSALHSPLPLASVLCACFPQRVCGRTADLFAVASFLYAIATVSLALGVEYSAGSGAGGYVHNLLLDAEGTVRTTPLGLAIGCALFFVPKNLKSGEGSDAARSECFAACTLACALLQHTMRFSGGWLLVRTHVIALPLADAIFESCDAMRGRPVVQASCLAGTIPCLLFLFANTLRPSPSTSWLAAVYTAPLLLLGLCAEIFKGHDAAWRYDWLQWSQPPRRHILLSMLLLPLMHDLFLSWHAEATLLSELVVLCNVLCALLFGLGLKPSAQPAAASLLVLSASLPAWNFCCSQHLVALVPLLFVVTGVALEGGARHPV